MENINYSLLSKWLMRNPEKKFNPYLCSGFTLSDNTSYSAVSETESFQGFWFNIAEKRNNFYFKAAVGSKINLPHNFNLDVSAFHMGIIKYCGIPYSERNITGASLTLTYQFSFKKCN